MHIGHLQAGKARKSGEDRFKCPVCKQSIWRSYRPTYPEHYPYIPKKEMCLTCIECYEKSHVADLKHAPLEELPLWMAHSWIFTPCAEDFNEILKNRLGISPV